ncbi:hypothetical protein D3C80_2143650 [compost metagenome]
MAHVWCVQNLHVRVGVSRLFVDWPMAALVALSTIHDLLRAFALCGYFGAQSILVLQDYNGFGQGGQGSFE